MTNNIYRGRYGYFIDQTGRKHIFDVHEFNPDAGIRSEGEVVASEAAEREPTLYGVRMMNNHEEFGSQWSASKQEEEA